MSGYIQKLKIDSPHVRPWPYPFQAGLSLSNDAEYMSFDFFKALMTYVNTVDETPFGKGLGMEMSSSVFFFSAHPYNFSYFDGIDAQSPVGPHAGDIVNYTRCGWIDTIHAYGDFDRVGGFTREHALRYYDVLKDNGISLPIYTNHGGVENIQNIGTDADYHQGDIADSLAYHADLLQSQGVRYIWTDSLTTKRMNTSGLKNRIKAILKNILKPEDSSLFVKSVLQDGRIMKGFRRFRSTGQNAPNLSSFTEQISQIEWNSLYRSKGAMVIYQHFGVISRINGICSAATIEQVVREKERYLGAFKTLHDQYHAKKLWVAGLLRFLDYASMVEATTVLPNGDGFVLEGDCQNKNPQEYFQGLTLYCDTSKPIQVSHKGALLAHDINPTDETGRTSITLPLIAKDHS